VSQDVTETGNRHGAGPGQVPSGRSRGNRGHRRLRSGPQRLADVAPVVVTGAEDQRPDARGPEDQGSEEPAGRRQAAADSGDAAEAITQLLRERLGEERFAVWFGESLDVAVADSFGPGARASVCICHDPGCTGDWLRKTFSRDVQEIASVVCGGDVTVTWQPRTATAPGAVAASRSGPSPSPAGRRPTAAAAGPPDTETPERARRQAGRPRRGRRSRSPAPAAGQRLSRLEDFVVGSSNRMAHAAVELAVSRLGEMSPVLLHGPSGVGKSHLLAAVCGRARQERPDLTTLVLSAEQFTTNFLQALRGSGLPGFRRSCRTVDLLAIDDLQFFVGKRATLLELQSTVDSLHRAGKQVIFASDRDVEALAGLGSELTGRLRGGITAALLPPDHEVRRGIVAGLAARRQLDLPDDVVGYLADHLTRHARELIGGVNRLEAAGHMLGVPVTLELARESLADLVRSSSRSLRLADVEKAVCDAFGLAATDLQNARRSRAVNHPRMLAMFLARKHTGAALTEIGRHFGRRSHSTVIAAEKTVRKWMATRADVVLADATWDIEQAIRRVEDALRAG